ncbi:MAG: helix-turn-helix transcriptional regulator, partial [Polyangiaceae bacterium]
NVKSCVTSLKSMPCIERLTFVAIHGGLRHLVAIYGIYLTIVVYNRRSGYRDVVYLSNIYKDMGTATQERRGIDMRTRTTKDKLTGNDADTIGLTTGGMGLIDTEGAARLLGMSAYTLVAWRTRSKVSPPYIRISGRCVRYRIDDVQRLIEARRVVPSSTGGDQLAT